MFDPLYSMHHTFNHLMCALWRPSKQVHKDLVLRWNLTKASHKSEQPWKTKVNNHENANGGKKSKSRGGKEQRLPSAHLGQNKGNKEGRRCWKTYRQLVNGSNIGLAIITGAQSSPKKPQPNQDRSTVKRCTQICFNNQEGGCTVHICSCNKSVGLSKSLVAIQIKWKLAFVLKKETRIVNTVQVTLLLSLSVSLCLSLFLSVSLCLSLSLSVSVKSKLLSL